MLYCQGNINTAMTQFDDILRRYPRSPRAQLGKALSLNALAERRQSNAVLEQAIDECLKVLELDDVPKELFIKVGTLCADRQSFRGIVCCLEFLYAFSVRHCQQRRCVFRLSRLSNHSLVCLSG